MYPTSTKIRKNVKLATNLFLPNIKKLKFSGIFPVEDASSVVLAFLLANIILWFTLDLVVFENYARYIFSIYPLLILISAGLVGKLRTPFTYRNLVFSAVILAFCLFAFVFRIIFFLCRWRSRRKAVQ